jgi:hypothetical protein
MINNFIKIRIIGLICILVFSFVLSKLLPLLLGQLLEALGAVVYMVSLGLFLGLEIIGLNYFLFKRKVNLGKVIIFTFVNYVVYWLFLSVIDLGNEYILVGGGGYAVILYYLINKMIFQYRIKWYWIGIHAVFGGVCLFPLYLSNNILLSLFLWNTCVFFLVMFQMALLEKNKSY